MRIWKKIPLAQGGLGTNDITGPRVAMGWRGYGIYIGLCFILTEILNGLWAGDVGFTIGVENTSGLVVFAGWNGPGPISLSPGFLDYIPDFLFIRPEIFYISIFYYLAFLKIHPLYPFITHPLYYPPRNFLYI